MNHDQMEHMIASQEMRIEEQREQIEAHGKCTVVEDEL